MDQKIDEKWDSGLCREFVQAIESSIYLNSKSLYIDFGAIGKEVVDLYKEYFK